MLRVDGSIATFTLDNSTTYTENIRGTFISLEVFGSLYLGGVAGNITVAPEAKNTPAFVGCISQFEEDERNSSELAPVDGLNVVNCNISACQEFVCENGGSCVLNSSSQLEPTCSCAEVRRGYHHFGDNIFPCRDLLVRRVALLCVVLIPVYMAAPAFLLVKLVTVVSVS